MGDQKKVYQYPTNNSEKNQEESNYEVVTTSMVQSSLEEAETAQESLVKMRELRTQFLERRRINTLNEVFTAIQNDIDETIQNSINLEPESFRLFLQQYMSSQTDQEKEQLFQSDLSIWQNDKEFQEDLRKLEEAVEKKVEEHVDPTFSQMVGNSFKSGWQNIKQSGENIKTAYQEAPSEFDPDGAWLGLVGGYASIFKDNVTPKTFFIAAGITGALGAFPKVAVPVFTAAEEGLKLTGKFGRTLGGAWYNFWMSFSREDYIWENPKRLFDGNRESTRGQMHLTQNFYELDQTTEKFVPDEMKGWYLKLIKGKEKLTPAEIAQAAEFSAQVFDSDITLDPEEYDHLYFEYIRSGEWNQKTVNQMRQAMITAYVGRTMDHFLSTENEEEYQKFEKVFLDTRASNKGMREMRQSGINVPVSFTEKKLESMFQNTITKDFAKVERKGIGGFLEGNGLGDILAVFAMIASAITGLTAATTSWNKWRKEQKEKKEDKNKDIISRHNKKKIHTLLDKKKKNPKHVRALLALLVDSKVITKNAKKKVMAQFNARRLFNKGRSKKNAAAQDFFHHLSTGPFRNALNGSIAGVASAFWSTLNQSEYFRGFDRADIERPSKLAANFESLKRRIHKESAETIHVTTNHGSFTISNIKTGWGTGWINSLNDLRREVPSLFTKDKFLFIGTIEGEPNPSKLVFSRKKYGLGNTFALYKVDLKNQTKNKDATMKGRNLLRVSKNYKVTAMTFGAAPEDFGNQTTPPPA